MANSPTKTGSAPQNYQDRPWSYGPEQQYTYEVNRQDSSYLFGEYILRPLMNGLIHGYSLLKERITFQGAEATSMRPCPILKDRETIAICVKWCQAGAAKTWERLFDNLPAVEIQRILQDDMLAKNIQQFYNIFLDLYKDIEEHGKNYSDYRNNLMKDCRATKQLRISLQHVIEDLNENKEQSEYSLLSGKRFAVIVPEYSTTKATWEAGMGFYVQEKEELPTPLILTGCQGSFEELCPEILIEASILGWATDIYRDIILAQFTPDSSIATFFSEANIQKWRSQIRGMKTHLNRKGPQALPIYIKAEINGLNRNWHEKIDDLIDKLFNQYHSVFKETLLTAEFSSRFRVFNNAKDFDFWSRGVDRDEL
jgi:hypothetical protein